MILIFACQFGKEHDLARLVLFKDCNAVLGRPGGSLRASRETIVRGVAPLGKDWPCQVVFFAKLTGKH